MFELCVDIDNKFKICVEDFISQDLTITELAKLISGKIRIMMSLIIVHFRFIGKELIG